MKKYSCPINIEINKYCILEKLFLSKTAGRPIFYVFRKYISGVVEPRIFNILYAAHDNIQHFG